MLEKVDLKKKLPKAEYKRRLPDLQNRLFYLQKACWQASIGTLIVFEGWDAAGKGTTITTLTERLEPRGFQLHAIRAPRTHEKLMPWLWRFWQRVPGYGDVAIFDRSWYGRVLVERVEKLTPRRRWKRAFDDIVAFERALSDDGYLILKFLLHISKQEQKRRFQALEQDPLLEWKVEDEDWEHHRNYDRYAKAYEEMLERTGTEWAPWTIVEATDLRWARVKVFETIIRGMEEALPAQRRAGRA
jgi:polyphosphate kinase 2 (PPK2 family)